MKKFRKISLILLFFLFLISLLKIQCEISSNKLLTNGKSKYAKLEGYNAALISDPDTSQISKNQGELSSFGSSENDGKVWTDKSVSSNDDGTFKTTLSALGQQYISNVSSIRQERVSADAVLVLDVTGSMEYGFENQSSEIPSDITQRRSYATVQGANEAIKIIMKANPKNRVSIVTFTTGNTTSNDNSDVLLPLDSYVPDENGNYLTYSSGKILSVSTGSSGNVLKEIPVIGGTNAQEGIALGGYQLWNNKDITNSTLPEGEAKRYPFFLFLTDGDTRVSTTKWYDNNTGVNGKIEKNYRIKYENSKTNAKLNALTILTAAYQKNKISKAYQKYNGDTDVKTIWFNVGLSVDDSPGLIKALLDPTWTSSDDNSSAESVRNEIKYATSNLSDPEFKDYGKPEKYIYTDSYENENGEVESYVTYVQMASAVNDAFKVLGDVISAKTSNIVPPVSNSIEISSGGGTVKFSDELGCGMELKGDPIIISAGAEFKLSGKRSFENDATIYSNDNLESLYLKAEDSGKISWNIPAELLPLYSFKNGKNYTKADPIRAIYNVGLSQNALNSDKNLSEPYYCGSYQNDISKTTAIYYPAIDNPYYYYTNEQVGAIGSPVNVGMTEQNFDHFYKGDLVENVTSGETIKDVFISTDMLLASNSPFEKIELGTLKNININEELMQNAELLEAVKKTIKNCIPAAENDVKDKNRIYGFHSGIPNFEEQSFSKVSNDSNTVEKYYRNDPLVSNAPFTVYLGNNGKLTLNAEKIMSKSVDKSAVPTGIDSILTYKITVSNITDESISPTIKDFCSRWYNNR